MLIAALGVVLIIEGVMPLLLPQAWRDTFKRMILFNDGQLRFIGLISVLGGLVLLWLA